MNAKEAVKLCLMAKAACPAMALEEDTPVMWGMLLDDVTYDDALKALVALAKTSPFVSPAEIRAQVKKARAQRIIDFGPLPDPPAEVGADPAGYRVWLAECNRRIADGEVTRPEQLRAALPSGGAKRPVMQLVSGAFRRVDQVEPVDGETAPPVVRGETA